LQASSEASKQFVNVIEKCYLVQHVTEPTRHGALLDLVNSSDPSLIDEVKVLSQFGSSDHSLLQWSVNLASEHSEYARECLDYSKADFDGIRSQLRDIDWDYELTGTVQNC